MAPDRKACGVDRRPAAGEGDHLDDGDDGDGAPDQVLEGVGPVGQPGGDGAEAPHRARGQRQQRRAEGDVVAADRRGASNGGAGNDGISAPQRTPTVARALRPRRRRISAEMAGTTWWRSPITA